MLYPRLFEPFACSDYIHLTQNKSQVSVRRLRILSQTDDAATPAGLGSLWQSIPAASKVLQQKLVTQQEAAATEPLASPVRPLVWCLAAPAVIILGSEFSMKPF
ncbi:hypothetical protein KY285_008082 [Solanum tuberosum]|nr:hypothetical protein KY285_008082 [Solanum tuberosum]